MKVLFAVALWKIVISVGLICLFAVPWLFLTFRKIYAMKDEQHLDPELRKQLVKRIIIVVILLALVPFVAPLFLDKLTQ